MSIHEAFALLPARKQRAIISHFQSYADNWRVIDDGTTNEDRQTVLNAIDLLKEIYEQR